MMSDEVDYEFKIVTVGRWGVGKSAFMTRYFDKKFIPHSIPTVGVDFRYKNISRRGKTIRLRLWDTMGLEKYDSITENYLRGAVGVILMFDLTEEESALVVTRWVPKIRELAWENATTILVGNKSDLVEKRQVSEVRGKAMAEFLQVKYFECSTKDNVNIEEAFDSLTDSILEKMAELKIPHFHPDVTRHPQGTNVRNTSGHPHQEIRLDQNPVTDKGWKCRC